MKRIINLLTFLNAFMVYGTIGAYEQEVITDKQFDIRLLIFVLISIVLKISVLVIGSNKHRKSKLQFSHRSLHSYNTETEQMQEGYRNAF